MYMYYHWSLKEIYTVPHLQLCVGQNQQLLHVSLFLLLNKVEVIGVLFEGL